ncbi:RagB/SusD family nutrient uptake outer membrane protein [Paludibacter jiangxiensis]|uniref:Starch-binding associating with outer membrane n=1 Tax=Paludibacter jiangxiensis TaxID=681398 RepID=A0A171A2R8_9BACT|nr:RagB/SusD family nutrient uptake outer membrane protein [Paludibacter jiangxiensis]GAT63240.1 starch-binding associating with outer membrane [Paludibacter jiangxiensis]
MRNILKLLVLIPLLVACSDYFEPAIENNRSIDAMYQEPAFAQGLLGSAYILLPYQNAPATDLASDDAVTNDFNNAYLRMATGSWTASTDAQSRWSGCRAAIQYLNLFLQNSDKVAWAKDPNRKTMYNDRFKGEAYALRALQLFTLLKAHGGWTSSGQLLGVPIDTIPQTTSTNFNVPRNTFKECVQQIYKDMSRAMALLPLDYTDIANASGIPAKYQTMGVTKITDYNDVFGNIMRGRITGRIVEAIKSQVALYAASPAFSAGTNASYADAADYAAVVIDRLPNKVNDLPANGNTWYTNTSDIDAIASGSNPSEIIWRSDVGSNLDLEKDNFPPSLFGKGRVNPSQNLVDAFPALNGYPISDSNSGYAATNPYANRDPRLAKYIVVNEGTQGPSSTKIISGTYNTSNNDVLNKQSGASTRTGYYLRKLLRADCNPDPSKNTGQKHYTARIRYTEIFLNYAEAANEAYGPTGTGSHSYSAYDVIKKIRQRAGITGGDAYLESIKSDKAKMRDLIRNERRIEMCFENQRFYDLRRWKVPTANLNETVKGMQVDKLSDGTLKYTPINVEARNYKDYMYFGPIPYSEIRKFNSLEQNAGW